MRVDLAAEARKLEEQLGMVAAEVGVFSAYRAFVARAYNVPPSLAGQPVAALEKAFAPNRAFVCSGARPSCSCSQLEKNRAFFGPLEAQTLGIFSAMPNNQ